MRLAATADALHLQLSNNGCLRGDAERWRMSEAATKILVIDDEVEIQRLLRSSLTLQGYHYVGANDAEEGLKLCTVEQPDLVMLDVMLPDHSGVDIIKNLREWSEVPIIVVSELDDEKVVIEALDFGADDYVTKPFHPGVLLARIRANLRCRPDSGTGDEPVMRCGDVEVDLARHSVDQNGTKIDLTPKEFDLLGLFVRHPGRVLTHKFILDKLWGPAQSDNVEYVRIFVKQLRDKLETDTANSPRIVTETGVGYRLEAPEE
jgi:two-component system KDP operon response regulator KdpE